MSENSENKLKIIRPQKGFQEKFVRSNVDFVVGGAAMGVGKSFAALLMAAEPSLDPNFRMVFIRKNIQDTKVGGGGVDETEKIYGDAVKVKRSENPRATFKNGAFVDFTHMDNENPEDVLERVKDGNMGLFILMKEQDLNGVQFDWLFLVIVVQVNGMAKSELPVILKRIIGLEFGLIGILIL